MRKAYCLDVVNVGSNLKMRTKFTKTLLATMSIYLSFIGSAAAQENWIDFYIKQPDQFVLKFICQDSWHYKIRGNKAIGVEPEARFVKLRIEKNRGSEKRAFISIDKINGNLLEAEISNPTGYYSFGGWAYVPFARHFLC